MNFEIKIFTYWFILLIASYVIAKLDYHFSKPNVYFKYYESFSSFVYFGIKYIGILGIGFWVFMQFTNYFFNGEFVFLE